MIDIAIQAKRERDGSLLKKHAGEDYCCPYQAFLPCLRW